MLLIVAYHLVRVGYLSDTQPLLVRLTGSFLGSWGILGVDIFVIISAWFLVDQSFKSKKVFSITFQVFTWLLFYYVVSVLLLIPGNGFSKAMNLLLENMYDCILQPLWLKEYWFVTAYVAMLLLSPLLNVIINTFQKEKFKQLLLATCFVPILLHFNPFEGTICDIIGFAYIYLIVGYIKRYGSKRLESIAKFRWFILLFGLLFISTFMKYLHFIPEKVSLFLCTTIFSIERYSVTMLIMALILFLIVINAKPRSSKLINNVSKYTFGVYLFHEHTLIGRDIAVGELILGDLTFRGFVNPASVLFPLQFILVIVGIFAIGSIIEWLRTVIIQKPVEKLVFKKCSSFFEKIDSIYRF